MRGKSESVTFNEQGAEVYSEADFEVQPLAPTPSPFVEAKSDEESEFDLQEAVLRCDLQIDFGGDGCEEDLDLEMMHESQGVSDSEASLDKGRFGGVSDSDSENPPAPSGGVRRESESDFSNFVAPRHAKRIKNQQAKAKQKQEDGTLFGLLEKCGLE